MKKRILALILMFFYNIATSQTNSKTENIKKLIELTGGGKIGTQIAQNIITSFKNNENYKNVPTEFWDEYSKRINPNDISKLTFPLYEKFYTDEDILQLIEFYNSPIGRKVIDTMPQLLQESMAAGREWGKELVRKTQEELVIKGYESKE